MAVLASRAEELGFDSLWLGEHPIIPITATSRYPGSADGTLPEAANRMADPFMALARASAITKTIKTGNWGLSNPRAQFVEKQSDCPARLS